MILSLFDVGLYELREENICRGRLRSEGLQSGGLQRGLSNSRSSIMNRRYSDDEGKVESKTRIRDEVESGDKKNQDLFYLLNGLVNPLGESFSNYKK